MGIEQHWETPENLARLPGINEIFTVEIINEMIKNDEVYTRQVDGAMQVKAIRNTSEGKPDKYRLYLKEPPTIGGI